MDKINIENMLSNRNIHLLPEEMRIVNLAINIREVQRDYEFNSIAEGNYCIDRHDCKPDVFVMMLEYAALTRKDFVNYNPMTREENKPVHEKIQHIKHMRAVFPFLGLKFAKELVEMAAAIDPNKYNYMNTETIAEEKERKDKEALQALRDKLGTNSNDWTDRGGN